MEVTESKLFNFVFTPEGQQFNFSIMADSQAEALAILDRRLAAVLEDLTAARNQKKSGDAN